jgi:hypothetical protein
LFSLTTTKYSFGVYCMPAPCMHLGHLIWYLAHCRLMLFVIRDGETQEQSGWTCQKSPSLKGVELGSEILEPTSIPAFAYSLTKHLGKQYYRGTPWGPTCPESGGVARSSQFLLQVSFCGSVCGGDLASRPRLKFFMAYVKNVYLPPFLPNDTQKVLFGPAKIGMCSLCVWLSRWYV